MHRRKKDDENYFGENSHPLDPQLAMLVRHQNAGHLLVEALSGYCRAAMVFDQQGGRFIRFLERYIEYTDSIADPDYVLAKSGATKVHQFLERYHALFNAYIHALGEETIAPFIQELDTLMDEPRKVRAQLDKAISVLETTRKKFQDTRSSKHSTAQKIRDAQDAQDKAKAAHAALEGELSDLIADASERVCSQAPRLFSSFYRHGEVMFSGQSRIAQDQKPQFSEFQQQYEADASGVLHKRVVTGTEFEKRYEELLKVTKSAAQDVAVLQDLRSRVAAEAPNLGLTPQGVERIFPSVEVMDETYKKVVEWIVQPLGQDERAVDRVLHLFGENFAELIGCYVVFVRNQGEAAFHVKRLRRQKAYAAVASAFEQSQHMTPGTLDIPTMEAKVSRHPHEIRVCLQAMFDALPAEDEKWSDLHDLVLTYGAQCERLDDLLVETEHSRQVLRIKLEMPEFDDNLPENPCRVFLYDSEVYLFPSGTLPPLADTTKLPQIESSSGGDPEYHLFLFNDYFIVAVEDSKIRMSSAAAANLQQLIVDDSGKGDEEYGDDNVSEGASGNKKDSKSWRIVVAVPLYASEFTDFGVPDDMQAVSKETKRKKRGTTAVAPVTLTQDKFACFALRAHGKETIFGVTTPSVHAMWTQSLSNAISERKARQIFAVPLSDIMSRESEKDREVPHVVEDLIEAIERDNMIKQEGIYRLSGVQQEVSRLAGRLDLGKKVLFTEPHETASALKLWLRLLPDPLCCANLLDDWQAVRTVEQAKAVLAKMPKYNVAILSMICKHIKNVASHESSNKMTINNLVIVFFPSIFRSGNSQEDAAIILQAAQGSNPLFFLVEHEKEIFTGDLSVTTKIRRSGSIIGGASVERSTALREKVLKGRQGGLAAEAAKKRSKKLTVEKEEKTEDEQAPPKSPTQTSPTAAPVSPTGNRPASAWVAVKPRGERGELNEEEKKEEEKKEEKKEEEKKEETKEESKEKEGKEKHKKGKKEKKDKEEEEEEGSGEKKKEKKDKKDKTAKKSKKSPSSAHLPDAKPKEGEEGEAAETEDTPNESKESTQQAGEPESETTTESEATTESKEEEEEELPPKTPRRNSPEIPPKTAARPLPLKRQDSRTAIPLPGLQSPKQTPPAGAKPLPAAGGAAKPLPQGRQPLPTPTEEGEKKPNPRPLPPAGGEEKRKSAPRPLPPVNEGEEEKKPNPRPLPPVNEGEEEKKPTHRPLPSTGGEEKRKSIPRPLPPVNEGEEEKKPNPRPLPPAGGGAKPLPSTGKPLPAGGATPQHAGEQERPKSVNKPLPAQSPHEPDEGDDKSDGQGDGETAKKAGKLVPGTVTTNANGDTVRIEEVIVETVDENGKPKKIKKIIKKVIKKVPAS